VEVRKTLDAKDYGPALLPLLLCFWLAGCTSQTPAPEKSASDFYHYYLPAFDDPDKTAYSSEEMQHYVAADTLKRLATIEKIEEQEIYLSDYFFYGQDYDSNWVSALKVGKPVAFLGGVVVPVSVGKENGAYKALSVFMRRENGLWKIYRVRDDTDDYEQPIFDAGRLTGAQEHARKLPAFK